MKLHFQHDTDEYEGLWGMGRVMTVLCQHTSEGKVGMNAFLKKRPPDFWKNVEPL